MEEAEAQFDLLKAEIETVRSSIRSLDESLVKVKSWCVTVVAALAAAAVTAGAPAVLLVGVGAAVVFWLVEAHIKSVQRIFIDRDAAYARMMRRGPILELLTSGPLLETSLGAEFETPGGSDGFWRVLRYEVRLMWDEATKPLVFNLYALVTLGLAIGFVVWMIFTV